VPLRDETKSVPEFAAQSLLKTSTVIVRDVYCHGSSPRQSREEFATATELVFPYRGVYVRHLGHDQAVAEETRCCFLTSPKVTR
jgi:AraC family transcriptional regulator